MKLNEENRALVRRYVETCMDVRYSPEAQAWSNTMDELHMKDLFGEKEAFEAALENCRAEQEALLPDLSNLEIPGFVPERAELDFVDTPEGFRYLQLRPKGSAPDAVHEYNLLYSHGGGFILQVGAQFDFCCLMTSELDCVVTVPVYPLAPTATALEMKEYMLAVYRDALARGLGRRFVFIGDSAGGWMSLALALWARECGLPQPKEIIPVSPVTDLSRGDAEMRALLDPVDQMIGTYGIEELGSYLLPGCDDMEAWMPSPVFADLRGLAPIHVFVGGREVLMADALMLRQCAAEQGVDVSVRVADGLWHCAAVMLGIPECDALRAELVEAITS